MLGSVDSLSLVRSFPKLRFEEIKELNFNKKKSEFGSLTWFDNGMREIHEPSLNFYRTWGKIYRLRVDINIPKLLYGSNIQLPSFPDLQALLELVSNNVKLRTRLKFDAFSADTCRIHYAFNQISEIDEVRRVIAHYASFNVPRMLKNVINDQTVYFENKSRGIRIYDKNAEICKKNPLPNLIEQSTGLTRYEYFLNGLTSVKRFAERLRFNGSVAREMLSEKSINTAIRELKTLLQYDKLNLTNQSKIGLIYQQTKDIKRAIQLSGFLDAVECFGKEFYRNESYRMSKTTYYRNIRECQKLGLWT